MLLLLLACPKPHLEPLDLTERLSSGQVRAGRITDEQALFGGIAAEGQVGDFKIYNDRVAFIIQSRRQGSYMSTYGGNVIDADIIRDDGIGRDLVIEWAPNLGFGRFVDPTSVRLADDGRDGTACVRVVGDEAAFQYLSGGFEIPHVDLGLRVVTDYILEPDSYTLEVRSTITATDGEATFAPGDILSGAREIADPWEPGVGLDAPSTQVSDLKGWVSQDNRVAVGILAPDTAGSGAAAVIENLMQMEMAFADEVTLAGGESFTYVRRYGVGPDMDTFRDGPTQTGEGPPGARVHVLVDGDPWSMGVVDSDGSWDVHTPQGAEIVLDARGTRYIPEFPDGAEDYNPYMAPHLREAALSSLAEGTDQPEPPRAQGLGILNDPAWLKIRSDGPFEARLVPHDPVEVDPRLADDYRSQTAWSHSGDFRFAMAPGAYDLVVHRGVRFEVFSATVELVEGQDVVIDAPLEQAYDHDGYRLSDPHMHAMPSSDGKISMEERLLTCVGTGLEVHYGTDHDHIADYNPLVDALGLDLISVVSSEVSPLKRGHQNLFPLESDPTQPNGGAWIWYLDPQQTTDDQQAMLRQRHPDALIQLNHPLALGVAGAAQWDPGEIGEPDFWTENFDLVEVLNDADYELSFFNDLVSRGFDVVATGTSDSHDHGSNIGFSATFVKDFETGDVVVTRGPFLLLEQDGNTLTAEAYSPSWIVVDRLVLHRDGEALETVDGTTATFTLPTDDDAWYVVIAEGDTPMAPLSNDTPWAMSRVVKIDVAGDGWTPPLPPLVE